MVNIICSISLSGRVAETFDYQQLNEGNVERQDNEVLAHSISTIFTNVIEQNMLRTIQYAYDKYGTLS